MSQILTNDKIPSEEPYYKYVLEVLEGGISHKEFQAKKGKHCDWCDYKDLLCPAWEKN